MDELKIFVPLTKVDVEKRLVFGCVAAEIADKANEIMDYESAKPQFESWSSEIEKASDGKSVGNLRAMHGNIAAGKLTTINFDDEAKRIEACGKVVDDAEWNKVLEGVYTGFSMGGKYLKRWKDADQPHLTRYTPQPAEVSLVDNPCIPTATFEVIKADGTTELRKFHTTETASQPTNVAPDVEQGWKAKDGSFHATKAAALAKNAEIAAEIVTQPATDVLARLDAALAKKGDGKKPYGDVDYADPGYQDDKKKRYPLDTEAHIRSAWSYINMPKNAKKYSSEEVGKIKAKIVSAWKAKIDKDGPPSASDKVAMAVNLAKGLWTVCCAADLIEQLTWLRDSVMSEELLEGDGSPAGKILGDAIDTILDWLAAYAQEEVNEAKTGDDTDVDYEGDEYDMIELAAHVFGLEKAAVLGKVLGEKAAIGRALTKAGARHSKTDQGRVQKSHDMAKSMHDTAVDLGADCNCDKAAGASDEDDDAGKLAKLTAENAALIKVRDEIIGKVDAAVARIAEQETRIADLEAQPAAGGPVVNGTRVISKSQDVAGAGATTDGDPVKAFQRHLESLPANQRALALMKMSLAQPMTSAPEPVGKRT